MNKEFAGVKANSDVSITVGKSQIHALLGENGAGKSTLVKIIYGLLQPDSGIMRFSDVEYAPKSPKDARALGASFCPLMFLRLNLNLNQVSAWQLYQPFNYSSYLVIPGVTVTVPSTTLVIFGVLSAISTSYKYLPGSKAPVTVFDIASVI